jgi:hypothetical protein
VIRTTLTIGAIAVSAAFIAGVILGTKSTLRVMEFVQRRRVPA